MDLKDLTDKAEAKQQTEAAKQRSDKFQGEFDKLLALLIALALAVALTYGASAGTCPAAIQPPVSPGSSEVAAPGGGAVAPPRPGQGTAPSPSAAAGSRGSAASPSGKSAAPLPVRQGETPAVAGAGARCGQGGSGLVGALLALLLALAALAMGTFVGFLFGLPRTLTSSEVREVRQQAADASALAGAPAAAAGSAGGRGSGSDVNTNLERISDWLTTIIVGVGLTKLEEIPRALESFGDNVDPYFAYGGKLFGIGGGLFFLIAGFFLAYVGTRVKLSLVFVFSQRTNQGASRVEALGGPTRADVEVSAGTSPLNTAALGNLPSEQVKRADLAVLSQDPENLKGEERIAFANAAARTGDADRATQAAQLYGEEAVARAGDPRFLVDYLGVLKFAGAESKAADVLKTIRSTAPQAVADAVDKAEIATLRRGLYNREFEASIVAGESLISRPIGATDPWIHLWLACAYGQRHAKLTASNAAAKEIAAARDNAVREVRRTLELQPTLKAYLGTLYDPASRSGDNDLTSLFGDSELDQLLLDKSSGEA